MNNRTYKVNSVSEILSLGTKHIGFWFRGHTKIIGELVPTVFRDEYKNFINLLNPESFFYSNFKRIAPSFSQSTPSFENNLEWLCLMQHHGLPTRLLDWSQNILVALYFAVYEHCDEDDKEDGELFGLDPFALNKKYSIKIPDYNNDVLQNITNQPFNENSKSEHEFPLAFLPLLSHPRLSTQRSAFTIHPNKKYNPSLLDILKKENELFRIIIPWKKKKGIISNLNNLGINSATLFQDLNGLAKSLKEGFEYYGVGCYKPNIEKIFSS